MSSSMGMVRSVLSKTSETLQYLAGFLLFPPLNIRSESLPALIALELLGPKTNNIESDMFDLPDPLGPVTAVYPSRSGTVSFFPNDLKFSNSICFKYI